MAVIASTAPPSNHLTNASVPAPTPDLVLVPAIPPSSSLSASSPDFTTPRSLANGSLVPDVGYVEIIEVVALPTNTSEYQLTSTKRKSEDRSRDQERDSKRWKADNGDSFMVPSGTPCAPRPKDDNVTVDAALNALLSLTSFQVAASSPSSPDVILHSTDITFPSSSVEDIVVPPAPIDSDIGSSLVFPAADLIQDPSLESCSDEDAEGEPDLEYQQTTFIRTPRPPVDPSQRRLETPLWKYTCKMRVDYIIQLHKMECVRALVQREVESRPCSPFFAPISPTATSEESSISPTTPSEGGAQEVTVVRPRPSRPTAPSLQLEICTPSDFGGSANVASALTLENVKRLEESVSSLSKDSEMKKEQDQTSESSDSLMDNTFDVQDWDLESDDESDFDLEGLDTNRNVSSNGSFNNIEDDTETEITSPHESLMFFPEPTSPPSIPPRPSSPTPFSSSSFDAPITFDLQPPNFSLSPLPRISSVLPLGLAEVSMIGRGTPRRVGIDHTGSLIRDLFEMEKTLARAERERLENEYRARGFYY